MPSLRQEAVARLTRLYPFYSGRGTLANSSLVSAMAGRSSELAWGRVRGGLLAPAPLDDYVGRAVYFMGELDPKVSWVFRKLVSPGDSVLDIGANIGLTAMILSSLVGPSGAVHAFEPNPKARSLLERAIEKNRARNVVVHGVALGREEGSLDLFVPHGHAGKGSLVPNFAGVVAALGETMQVPVKTLDQLFAETQFDRLRLVKMDVEGFEAEVLRGARSFFDRCKPSALVFEIAMNDKPLGERESVRLLDEFGYDFLSIPKTLARMRVRPASLREVPEGHDMVAVRRGAAAQQVVAALSRPW
ncbi:MAG: FkbM family methyltransferase [Myxococcota bacterium]